MARLSDMLVSTFALATVALALVVPKDVHWSNMAISASSNGRYLPRGYRTKMNEPFFWIADTNWELFHKLNPTDVDLFLADRAAKGFNVIQAVLLSKYNVTTIPNFYGDLAIDNEDFTQPNGLFLRRLGCNRSCRVRRPHLFRADLGSLRQHGLVRNKYLHSV